MQPPNAHHSPNGEPLGHFRGLEAWPFEALARVAVFAAIVWACVRSVDIWQLLLGLVAGEDVPGSLAVVLGWFTSGAAVFLATTPTCARVWRVLIAVVVLSVPVFAVSSYAVLGFYLSPLPDLPRAALVSYTFGFGGYFLTAIVWVLVCGLERPKAATTRLPAQPASWEPARSAFAAASRRQRRLAIGIRLLLAGLALWAAIDAPTHVFRLRRAHDSICSQLPGITREASGELIEVDRSGNIHACSANGVFRTMKHAEGLMLSALMDPLPSVLAGHGRLQLQVGVKRIGPDGKPYPWPMNPMILCDVPAELAGGYLRNGIPAVVWDDLLAAVKNAGAKPQTLDVAMAPPVFVSARPAAALRGGTGR